ncbi:hypothetical protein LTR20_007701 [Exophiala xenobiotica]|nr:hypothetical protein LTS13_007142 [Exophiala xenobiotica]KAK5394694.1 hypothetical protein LTR79_008147 [Exophiala xenobiotica]KAK5409741.1 hypothetical protein LTR90_008932 [Exophiala xenobiotica]KAK5459032.1 hypothetical protein LTR20_007701 [Exophiala xenobiotica]KAK5475183.1 hypothetical protein LTR26_009518 [Exophiala xenobiotica]
MTTTTASSKPWPHSVYSSDPYAGLPMIGNGMTGYILQLDEGCVVKVAKTYSLDVYVGTPSFDDMEYINEINVKTLENEVKIYQRLGHYEGIINCLQTSNYGIELAFAKQGNLEDYIKAEPEPPESLKIEWILSVIDTLSYVHSQRVLVDEIAPRNFLVADGHLKLADFGQSLLLPISTDMDTVCDNDLTTRIEILHLGWVIYSIAVWHVHTYYFFDKEHDMQWPNTQELPLAEGLFCKPIVEKCWNGQYINMKTLKDEAYKTLVCDRKQSVCCL